MLIENPESLKTWLTSYLEPLCDADPQALAQYVMALIGKDKPAKDLKNNLFEQLEVFLQKETEPFVEVLFQTLENKSYLDSVHSDSHSSTSSERSPSGCDGIDTLPSTVDHYKVHGTMGSPLPSLSPEYDPKQSLLNIPDSSGNSAPSNQLTSTAHSKRSYHNRERSKSRSHSRSRSRSRTPPISSSQNRHRPRDVDMRRPGGYAVVPNQGGSRSHYIEERNRRTGWNGPSSRGMSRRYGPSSSSSSLSLSSSSHLGGGYRRNQQQVTRRSRSRSKSRTQSRSRSRSYSPQSNRSRSPSHDRGRTKDKTRSKTQNRVQSTSRSRSRNRDGPAAKRTRISSKSPLEDEREDEKEEKPYIKKRCRDYDERGFCMRGDLCQFDHGSDPVVLDGAVSSVVLGLAANGATTLTATQGIAAGSANFLNEPYNPEAPGIDKQMNPHGARRGSGVGALVAPLRVPVKPVGNNYNHLPQHPFWSNLGTPLRPMPPGPSSSSFIPSLSQQNRPRELVGVPTLSDGKNSSSSNTKSEIPKIPHKSTIDTLTTTISGNNKGSNSHTTSNNMSKRGGHNSGLGGGNGSGHRGGFRGGYIKRMVTNESADKCTLEVRKIPPNLNTIANLNSHFSKFGSIVNLQVCYDGDPEAALVQFASHSEALSAHRCTEAVLNNRFIKVFWHSKDQSQQSQQSQPPTNLGPGHTIYNKTYDSSLRDRNAANGSLVNDSKNIDSNNSRPSVKDRLGLRHATDQDKNSVSTNVTSSGSISRTVFNPLLLKKQYPSSASIATSTTVNQVSPVVSNPGLPNSDPVVPAKSKEDLKKDKLLQKLDLQKKRQQILLSCMQQQKLLIDKLQKAKTDKEKTDIRSTVAALDKQIKKLESDIKKDAEVILAETAKLPSSGKKSKIQVEKELLDVEMDFYNELHKGATTTELNKKLQELKIKTKSLCMNDVRYTKTMMKRFAEMKGALRGRNRLANHTLAKNFENLRKVDRRTRKIFIEGVPEDDNNVLLAHLSQTAEIESLESMPQGVMVTFKTRRDAEMALPLISTVKLKDQVTLKASWFDEAKVKTEDTEMVNSIDKPSDLESLIENEINLNNEKLDDVDVDQEDLEDRENVDDDEIPEAREENLKEEQEEEQEQEEEDEYGGDTEEDVPPEDQDDSDDDDDDETPKGVNVKIDADEGNKNGENEIVAQDHNQASPADELLLGVGVDDLLEEEETDDEDESRAWRR